MIYFRISAYLVAMAIIIVVGREFGGRAVLLAVVYGALMAFAMPFPFKG